MTKPLLHKEAISLRVNGRLSLREIQNVLKVSKGTLSLWLRPYPLTSSERSAKVRSKGIYRANTHIGCRVREGFSPVFHSIAEHRLKGPQIAKVAEAAIMLRALARGFSVYGSMFDGDVIDWVFEVPPHRLWKVQVKCTRQDFSGKPLVAITKGHSSKRGRTRYLKGEFDFLIGYDLRTDTAYIWHWSELKKHKTMIAATDAAKEAWDKMTARGSTW
jgi:hypothetical protein